MRNDNRHKGYRTPNPSESEALTGVNSVDANALIDKAKQNNLKRKNKIRVYYSLLTIVLLLCVAQIGFGAILNMSKTVSYITKINTMKKIKSKAEDRNVFLKTEIDNFSSASSLEAIARNNLKMAGDDEVLVIINKADKEPQEPRKKSLLLKNGFRLN